MKKTSILLAFLILGVFPILAQEPEIVSVKVLSSSDKFKPSEIYNISGDEYHDIKFLSDLILKYLEKDDSLVDYVDFEVHNTRNKQADNTKAKKDLYHKFTVNLEEGIRRTIDWQREYYNV